MSNGGPAFPYGPTKATHTPYEEGGGESEFTHGNEGMSLRDYFAGQALAGICANPNVDRMANIVAEAYKAADAMLAERERSE